MKHLSKINNKIQDHHRFLYAELNKYTTWKIINDNGKKLKFDIKYDLYMNLYQNMMKDIK